MDRRVVDVHCHCLAGVDDGPASIDDALALARALVQDGFTDVIATPHMLGRYEGLNGGPQVRGAAAALQRELDRQGIQLKVHPGGEVRVDERIPELLKADRILSLADAGKFLLLELSSASYIAPTRLLPHLTSTGAAIILAHAERYPALQRDPAAAEAWIDGGAMLQLNADSVVGGAGPGAEAAAWWWLERGWVDLIATDAHHATRRRPRMREASAAIRERMGEQVARRLCIENPLVVLTGGRTP